MNSSFLDTKLSDLEHSGTKGMKWGVRNALKNTARVLGLGPKHEDKAEVEKIQKTKLVKEMSNAELAKVTKRLQLEQSYKTAIENAQPQGRKMYVAAYKKYAQEATDKFVKSGIEVGSEVLIRTIMGEINRRKGG